MKTAVKNIVSAIAALALALPLLVAAPGRAEAHRYRHHGGDVAAGVAAAIIGGIIISQIGRRHHRRYYYNDYDDYDYGYYQPRYYSSYGYYPRSYGWSGGRHWRGGHHGLRILGHRGHW